MRVKGNVRIFGVPQSFLSDIYSKPSPFLLRYNIYRLRRPLYAELDRETAGRHLEAKSKHIQSSCLSFFKIRQLKSTEETKTLVTQIHVAACTELADNTLWAEPCQQAVSLPAAESIKTQQALKEHSNVFLTSHH